MKGSILILVCAVIYFVDACVTPEATIDEKLVLAAWKGNSKAVAKLLAAGANVNERDSYGRTALIYAANGGHTEIVKNLLDIDGINLNVKDNNGNTARGLTWNHDTAIKKMLDDRKALCRCGENDCRRRSGCHG